MEDTLTNQQKFDLEFEELKRVLGETQGQLDKFLDVSAAYAAEGQVNIKFFDRVNAGKITENFSSFVQSLLEHDHNLKQAMKPKVSSES